MKTEKKQLREIDVKISNLLAAKEKLENGIASKKAKKVIAMFNDKETSFDVRDNTIYVTGHPEFEQAVKNFGNGFYHFKQPISLNVSLNVNDETIELIWTTREKDYDKHTLFIIRDLIKMGVEKERFSFAQWDALTAEEVKKANERRDAFHSFYTKFDSSNLIHNLLDYGKLAE